MGVAKKDYLNEQALLMAKRIATKGHQDDINDHRDTVAEWPEAYEATQMASYAVVEKS